MATVRCPMRECRRRIDLEALPPAGENPAEPPCLHFVAWWADENGADVNSANNNGAVERGMVDAVLLGLEGNRELVLRNLRPREEDARALLERSDREALVEAIRRDLHVVDDRAAFGDPHERAAAARDLAQVIIGPDPMLGGGTMR